jgi:hypothetical protein
MAFLTPSIRYSYKIGGIETMFIKACRKTKIEMDRPSGRGFKEDENEKL